MEVTYVLVSTLQPTLMGNTNERKGSSQVANVKQDRGSHCGDMFNVRIRNKDDGEQRSRYRMVANEKEEAR